MIATDTIIETRMPPQDLAAEMCVLASMILDREILLEPEVVALESNDFYREDHRLIFDAMRTVQNSTYNGTSQGADIILLRDELDHRGQLQKVGGVEYLARLMDSVPHTANAVYYAKVVREKSLLRRVIRECGQLVHDAYGHILDPREFIDHAETSILKIAGDSVSDNAIVVANEIGLVCESLLSPKSNSGGLTTGFQQIDERLNGLQKGDLIIVAARPSMGKTALGLNIADHVSKTVPVLFFSLEMSREAIMTRLLSGRSGVDSYTISGRFMVNSQRNHLAKASDEIKLGKLLLDDSPSLTPLELRAKARRLKLKHDIQLVVVDYLQLMHSPNSESRFTEISFISRQLKALARELNIPVIAMSQLNRLAEQRSDHRPMMSDLRESGNIEQDADLVILLHRPDAYKLADPKYMPTNEVEVTIAKHRNGPTGVIKLLWHGPTMSFKNLTKESSTYD